MAKRKILFISARGDILPLALRVEQEGNEVKVFIKCLKETPEAYADILAIEKDWRAGLKWCDLAVFDCNCELTEQRQAVYHSKKPAFNACFTSSQISIAGKTYKPWDFLLATEMERAWGHSIMESMKIGEKMARQEFSGPKGIEQAKEYVEKNPAQYVVKVEGEADSDSTYLGITEDGLDVVRYLETFPFRKENAKVKKIELEKKIKGVEVACGGYFNGEKFVCLDINFEHKKFLETPYSFLTGEMGTTLIHVKDHRLYQETLAKMVPFLKSIDFRGNVDINCIVNEDGLFPLEFTFGRFGYPAVYIEMEGMRTRWGDLLWACANKEDIDVKTAPGWMVGVVLCGQGYPFYGAVGCEKMKYMPVIIDEPAAILPHLQLCDIRLLNGNVYTTNAYVGCATGQGATIEDAQKKVYEDILPEVKIPNTYYREDIGDRVIDDLEKLTELGYNFGGGNSEEAEDSENEENEK